MENIRTDLALEAHEMYAESAEAEERIDGVEVDVRAEDGISVTKISIQNENGEKTLGKPKGTYVTIEAPGN